MRRLYDWTLDQATKPHALWFLAFIAFIESSIFPIPPDILIIPMVLAVRSRAWLVAGVATVASVTGGLAGYGIGYYLFDDIGLPLLEFYGKAESFEMFKGWYNDFGAWIVFGAGITPFPYKVITIASGVTQLNLGVFMIASVLARAARFFLVAGLLWYFGPVIREFIEKRLGLLTILFFVSLIGGFVALKYLM